MIFIAIHIGVGALEMLDLSDNQLSLVPSYNLENWPFLTILELSDCPALEYLSHNKIQTINHRFFSEAKPFKTCSARGSPWCCNCSHFWLPWDKINSGQQSPWSPHLSQPSREEGREHVWGRLAVCGAGLRRSATSWKPVNVRRGKRVTGGERPCAWTAKQLDFQILWGFGVRGRGRGSTELARVEKQGSPSVRGYNAQ